MSLFSSSSVSAFFTVLLFVSGAFQDVRGQSDAQTEVQRTGAGSKVKAEGVSTSGVWINEFLASNKHGIHDEDGDSSDWIELYNSGGTAINLADWRLHEGVSSNLVSWAFPEVTLASHAYLVVFASGKNRTNANSTLHTSFVLKKEGDSLELVDPFNNVVSAFAAYPPQVTDVSYGRDPLSPFIIGYFTTPTPGAANTTSSPGFAPNVKVSQTGGTFTSPFFLTLASKSKDAVIRYTFGENLPTSTSPIYVNPIAISNTVEIHAQAFVAGLLPGEVRTEDYIRLDPNALNFTSDLPLVIFHNLGGGPVPASIDQYVMIQVFEPTNGVSSLTNPPNLKVDGTFHLHGSSTLFFPKSAFSVQTLDSSGNSKDVPMAGLPSESDWVFYGIDSFDRVLIHNPLAHELYRQMGHYSSRTRFVEVFLRADANAEGSISTQQYNGLYVLEEKIKVGKNRVAINKLALENTNAPAVTGGYLFSIDRGNAGESQFSGAGAAINYLSPKYSEISTPQWTAQRRYVASFFQQFGNSLNSVAWTNNDTGYRAYADIPEWIDYHIHEVVTFNVDALRLSSYFYKPRTGKLTMGVPWDYDRSQGSADGRDFNPRVWRSKVPDYGTDMFNASAIFNNPWWSKMFKDPDFWQAYIDRYEELRNSVLSLTNLYSTIDYFGNQVRQAQVREVKRWRGSGASDTSPRAGTVSSGGYSFRFSGTYQGEIDFLKVWYSNRLDFIDGQFVAAPHLVQSAAGDGYALSSPSPNGKIFYTLDGSDPRARGGAISPTAIEYTQPIQIAAGTSLTARVYDSTHSSLTGPGNPPLTSFWSGPLLFSPTNNIVLSDVTSLGNSLAFSISGPSGVYTVERTSDGVAWSPVSTIQITNQISTFRESVGTDRSRFYRVSRTQ